MSAVETAQAIGFVESAMATTTALLASLTEFRDKLKGTSVLKAETKVPPTFDPAWFKNQTNRHLTEIGKKHLRHLLTELGMNKNQAATAMGIEPAAVAYWFKRWGL